jgi:hypothetical protein
VAAKKVPKRHPSLISYIDTQGIMTMTVEQDSCVMELADTTQARFACL